MYPLRMDMVPLAWLTPGLSSTAWMLLVFMPAQVLFLMWSSALPQSCSFSAEVALISLTAALASSRVRL